MTIPTVPSAQVPAPARAQQPPARPRAGLLLRSWAWGWLAIVHLCLSVPLAVPYLVIAVLGLAGVCAISGIGFGALLLMAVLPAARWFGGLERLRVEAFLGVRIPPPRPLPAGAPWWRRHFLDSRSWRALLHLTAVSLWGLVAGSIVLAMLCLSLPLAALPLYAHALPHHQLTVFGSTRLAAGAWVWGFGTAMLLTLPLVARGLTGVDLALARALLGPRHDEQVAELTERVETLTHTREMAVDSVEAERRRIERDLHDGPQQRLVAIAMDLGLAQTKLERDPDGAKELLGKAHTAAKEAIVEMRQVARGIHPPVLTDRGLDAALSALAARSPVPVAVQVELPARPSPTIEAIAYFCVSEALTNVAKHSGARAASVQVSRAGGRLLVQIADDGRGGADPTRGTGLIGLRQRLAAVDGSLSVDSPPGGGTQLTMTLPERTESPRQASTGSPPRRPEPAEPAPSPRSTS